MAVLGSKWPFFERKRTKKSNFGFFAGNFFSPFFLRPKSQFIWQKLARSYDWIWRNWSKWPFWGQNGHFLSEKRPKKGGTRFFSKLSLGNSIKRPKMQFLYAILAKSYERIWRNRSKWPFWGQNGHFLSEKGPKCQISDFSREQFFRHFF